MSENELIELLRRYKDGGINDSEILETISRLPFHDLGCAKLDTHRAIRCGVEEVIFCPGKSPEHLRSICKAAPGLKGVCIFTRVSPEQELLIAEELPETKFYPEAGIAAFGKRSGDKSEGIAVVTGGTSDIRVAEEAAVTAELLGNKVERIYDVGAAGIHRLFPHMETLRKANAIVVVAGMEGALVTVVGGLVSAPVIAVPTSVGYGANLGGMTTMLSMLNCCVPGVSVVNIDNGFGGGVSAHLINRKVHGK
ncbi:nickel pincer cofactor biosynthesis protein LarB [Maridesulfovibrio hydrothermalis]|uniref:1-(5-phosphoribosyl)-5-amino-4-imidazole-carboxylate (AIR) carboxylase n=1 Tax=Maridesulfovibrio hydrothermalis AM13 = DSM 14728 TaxID=1121451 RepID=L0RG04_9BACT|nr:nickel pincer cofactor biosynthesis protein LarB [Maridesulfovibrio hydrothermalis]CCO24481.1 1-(5-phosphoribosyl)-5-amino-4-imidazole-carboxylate (AIR) carboxylase [Maridesulfovibrio hydrothermalis AM13 = DSM 14728]